MDKSILRHDFIEERVFDWILAEASKTVTLHVDGFPNAGLFAEAAADAFFFVHNGNHGVLPVKMGLHSDTIEGAGVHAIFASNATIFVNFSFGNILGFNALDKHAVAVFNRIYGAPNAASAAINTTRGDNLVKPLFLSNDGVCRALDFTNRAANAFVCNKVSHTFLVPENQAPVSAKITAANQ